MGGVIETKRPALEKSRLY